jgi:protease IV
LVAKKKPLIVSMGSAAASGGYYASAVGSPIYANASTLTGSIGIFYGKVDVAQLLDMLNVKSEAYQTAPRADAESLFRPFDDDERKELGRKVKQFYDLFVGRVADGRKMSVEAVDAVARGKVWTGAQAKDHGLVDEIGGLRQALEKARELGDVDEDAALLLLPRRDQTLLDFVLGLVGFPKLTTTESGWIPPPVLEIARALVPFAVFDPTKPLALMELMVVE